MNPVAFRFEQVRPNRVRPNPSKHGPSGPICPPLGDLITRRSRVRIPPPLLQVAALGGPAVDSVAIKAGLRAGSWAAACTVAAEEISGLSSLDA